MMRVRASTMLLVVACMYACTVNGLLCGQRECITGDACCADGVMGHTCFDPYTHDCVDDRRLCGEGLGVCGSVCYDTAMYACYNNGTLCPRGMQACGQMGGAQCYDPSLYRCESHTGGQLILISTTLFGCAGIGYNPLSNDCDGVDIVDIPIQSNCSVGQKMCGSQCYDPVLYDCVQGGLKSLPGVCGVGLLWCYTQCYDPSHYNCVNASLQLADNITYTCPSGQLSCGSACYDSSAYACFGGSVLCSAGMKACGPACYNEDRYECMNETLVGRPGYCAPQYSLCGYRCYDRNSFNCVRGILVPITSGALCSDNRCPAGDMCCSDMVLGDVCYSPNTHDCVDSRRLCGNNLKACGTICYDHNLYVCVSENVITERNRLCPANFAVCGDTQCYDSSKYTCLGGSVLCLAGAPVCGSICYNRTTYTCQDGTLVPRNDTSTDDSSSSSSSDNDSSSSSSSSSSSDDSSSGDELVICQTGQLRCGNVCYTQDAYGCVDDNLVIICGTQQELCGNMSCYNPNTYKCMNNTVMPRVNCTSNEEICGLFGSAAVCYDPDQYKCINGTVLPLIVCQVNEMICGSTCYNVDLFECINRIIVGRNFSCDGDFLRCGSNDRCFDPKLYTCVGGVLSCINLCLNTCYDTEEAICLNNKVVPYIGCATGLLRCGTSKSGTCFSASVFACVNSTLQCLNGMQMCGENQCYDISLAACVDGTLVAIQQANAVSMLNANILLVVLLALLCYIL